MNWLSLFMPPFFRGESVNPPPAAPKRWMRSWFRLCRIDRICLYVFHSGGSLRLKAVLPDLLVLLTAIAVLWGAIAYALIQKRHDAFRSAVASTAAMAGIVEENVNRTVQSVDQTLLFVRAAYAHDPDHFDLKTWIRSSYLTDQTTLQVSIIDRAGILVSSTSGPVAHRVDASEYPDFAALQSGDQDNLLISPPVIGGHKGHWLIQFSRKLTLLNGDFAGVVVVSLDPYILARAYEQLDANGSIMTLMRRDGIILARTTQAPSAIGVSVKPFVDPLDLNAASEGFTVKISQIDNISRLYNYHALDRYPLIVVTGQKIDHIYAPFQNSLIRYLSVGIFLSLLIFTFFMMLIRQKVSLIRNRESMSDMLANISQGIIMVDAAGNIPVISKSMTTLLDIPPTMIDKPPNFGDIIAWQIDNNEFHRQSESEPGVRSFIESSGLEGKSFYQRVRPNGTVVEVRTNLLPRGGAIRTYTDVTARKMSDDRVHYLAHHDPLTGLINRATFHEMLSAALLENTNHVGEIAVLLIDLDGFKHVNDVYGHATGDALLQLVARRLTKAVRAGDTVGRLGGDEFAIIETNVCQPDAAMQLGARLVEALIVPFEIDGHIVSLGTSIGLAVHGVHGESAENLLNNADIALYDAKDNGRGGARLFEFSMNIPIAERRLLESGLKTAVQLDQFAVHYQNIISIETNKVIGVEALIRWLHPDRGFISPSRFIPVAEASGHIVSIGEWVLKTACAQAALWPEDVFLSVNVSPLQFAVDDFPERVLAIVAATGLPTCRLTLEITETALIENSDRVADMIDRLRSYNIRVALDDFGTGQSSLSHLQRFNFDIIKIDKSFIQAIAENARTRAIVAHVVSLGRALGADIIAEGVETVQQLEMLAEMGCFNIQGHLLGRPEERSDSHHPKSLGDHDTLRNTATFPLRFDDSGRFARHCPDLTVPGRSQE